MTDVLGPGAASASPAPTTTTDVSNPTAGDTWFLNCSGSPAANGTPYMAQWANRLMQQLRRVIRLTGIPLSNSDDDMLGQAIQSGAMNFAGTLGGTANALTATLSPVVPSLIAGLRVRGQPSATNTGAATLNVNGLGAVAITTASGVALTGGEMLSGRDMEWEYDGTNFAIVSPPPTFADLGSAATQCALTLAANQSITMVPQQINVAGSCPFGTVSGGVVTFTRPGIYVFTGYVGGNVSITGSPGNIFLDARIQTNIASAGFQNVVIETAANYATSATLASSVPYAYAMNVGDQVALAVQAYGAGGGATVTVNGGGSTPCTLTIVKVG